jgi:hypothetical protein
VNPLIQRLKQWNVPLALLTACLLAFGVLIPRLGFYQDDWHFVYNAYARGTQSMWPLLYSDGRPWAAWPYVVGFKLLGFAPLGWHLLSFGLRWLTSLLFWLTLRELWPKHPWRNFAAALLFAIHPFFTLQSLAVAYAPHWVAFSLYAASLYTMLLAVREPRRFWLWFSLSLAAMAVEIFTIEYFAGLELVRPLILWFALRGESTFATRRFWRVWAGYLAVFAAFVVWRSVIFDGPRAVLPGLERLAADPLAGALYYAKVIWADVVSLLAGAWANTLQPQLFNLAQSANVKALALGALAAGLGYILFTRWMHQRRAGRDLSSWRAEAALIGLAWIVGGLAPAYAIDEVVFLRNPLWSSRLALAALPGAALLTWAALDWFVRAEKPRTVLLCLLVGLAVAFNANKGNEFSRVWQEELRFYQQLQLRAPSIEPGTAIISEEEFVTYMGDYPVSFAVNAAYAEPQSQSAQIPLWYFPISSSLPGRMDDLFSGMDLQVEQYSSTFSGNSLQALYISYSSSLSPCLWVLGPESAELTRTSAFLRTAGTVSDLARISNTASGGGLLPAARQDWCATFQRGDLGRQLGEWERVAALWNEAETSGLAPYHAYEFSPFVEAFLHLQDWEAARRLTVRANQINDGAEKMYCALWAELAAPADASPERDAAMDEIDSRLDCAS